VTAGRLATILLFICSSAMVFELDTAAGSFNVILQIGAGTGLLYLVRWFWWRVTAWCEIVAMVSSFAMSLVFLVMTKNQSAPSTAAQLLITIAVTTVCWLATAYFGPQNDPRTLVEFYRKVRPFGPGWAPIRVKAGLSTAAVETEAGTENFTLSLLGWFAGCIMIWSALFTVGNFLYGRMGYAFGLLAVFVVTGTILIRVVRRLWS
jgi:hypothetical protein